MRPRSVAVAVAAGAAGLVALRRRRAKRVDHVDLYFADGSSTSLDGADSGRMLDSAREALAAARSSGSLG